jgi:hypothetical protein
MRFSRFAAAALFAAALAACAGPQSRIKRHQAEFDSYPPAVQQKIRAGQVDVGFTDRQVALALGRPDRVYSRKTASAQQEVWVYGGGGSHAGIGMGFGMGMGPGVIAVDSGPDIDSGERVRVVLQDGGVVSVEDRRK